MTEIEPLKIKLSHRASIGQSAYWCEPVGWEPKNKVDDAEFVEGAWWGEEEEEAGIVWFGNPWDFIGADEEVGGAEITVKADDLRVVASGNCRVIAEIQL